MRVTEDLRAIQRELNCAAMEAPTDPELMEALKQVARDGFAPGAEIVARPDASFPVVLHPGHDQRI